MRKLLLISFLTPLLLCAQPSVTSRQIQDFGDSIIVTYTLQDYAQVESSYYPGAYEIILPDFASSCSPGEPSVLYKTDCFVLPYGASTSCTITDTLYEEFPIYLSPAIPVPDEDSDTIPLCPITPYSGYFPSELLDYEAPDVYRKESLQFVTISPIQYDYENQRVRKYSYIRYRIDVSLNGNVPPRQFEDDAIVANLACNYSTWKQRHAPANLPGVEANATEIHNGLLIVTTDEYRTALHEFIEWKQLKGNEVHVTSKPKGQWTTEEVEDSVRYCYNNDDNIKNLLIVGGHDDVPARIDSLNTLGKIKRFPTDYFYGIPLESGGIPQLHRGRIPINNVHELNIVIKKIMQYEVSPTSDTAFYNNCNICAYFQDIYTRNGRKASDGYEDRAFVLTAENMLQHLAKNGKSVDRIYYSYVNSVLKHWSTTYSDGTLIPDYLEYPEYLWNGDSLKILSSINNGVFLSLYRGHGNELGWLDVGFGVDDIGRLGNGNMLPVVASITCLTGKFNSDFDCLAEAFLKKDSAGCVGIYAATEELYTDASNHFSLGIVDAIWPVLSPSFCLNGYNISSNTVMPVYQLGEILDVALLKLLAIPNRSMRKTSMKLLHFFGDPTTMIYTEAPNRFSSPSISISNGNIIVETDSACTMSFYDTMTGNSAVLYGKHAQFPISSNLKFCMDLHNYIPFLVDTSANIYIQDETINGETRQYVGNSIEIGEHVTSRWNQGKVLIQQSNVNIYGSSLKLDAGTNIQNSNFIYIPRQR